MALFNEILTGRYNALLHKLLVMKDGAPAPTLGTDISPGLTLESDRPEWLWLGGEMMAVGMLRAGAVAAVNSRIRLRLLVPNLQVVVEKCIVTMEAAGNAVLYIHADTNVDLLDVTGSIWPRDTRWWKGNHVAQLTGSLTLTGENSTTNTVGADVARVSFPGAGSFVYDVPHILSSDRPDVTPLMEWRASAVNLAMVVTYIMRVRAQEPSETR